MECKISNDLGLITISEDVLLKVAGYAALECYGIVAMSSKRAKDGFVEWLGRENLTKGVQVNITDDGDRYRSVHHRRVWHFHCGSVQHHQVPGVLQDREYDGRPRAQSKYFG